MVTVGLLPSGSQLSSLPPVAINRPLNPPTLGVWNAGSKYQHQHQQNLNRNEISTYQYQYKYSIKNKTKLRGIEALVS